MENLGLCRLLDNELEALEQFARVFGDEETLRESGALRTRLADRLAQIRAELPAASCWDRDTHCSTPAKILFEGPFSEIPRDLQLSPPSRVNMKIIFSAFINKPGFLSLLGTGMNGEFQEERVEAGEILRLPDCLALTSSRVFARLESISAPDLDERTWTPLYTSDLTLRDVGWFLGWQAPTQPESAQAEDQSPEQSVFDAYPFGLPDVLEENLAGPSNQVVNPVWNTCFGDSSEWRKKKKPASSSSSSARGRCTQKVLLLSKHGAARTRCRRKARRGSRLIPIRLFSSWHIRIASRKLQITVISLGMPLTVRKGVGNCPGRKNSTIPCRRTVIIILAPAKTFQAREMRLLSKSPRILIHRQGLAVGARKVRVVPRPTACNNKATGGMTPARREQGSEGECNYIAGLRSAAVFRPIAIAGRRAAYSFIRYNQANLGADRKTYRKSLPAAESGPCLNLC